MAGMNNLGSSLSQGGTPPWGPFHSASNASAGSAGLAGAPALLPLEVGGGGVLGGDPPPPALGPQEARVSAKVHPQAEVRFMTPAMREPPSAVKRG